MEYIKKILPDIWTNAIKNEFNEGYLTYERHVQAELYHNLRIKLPADYKVWVEPVIHGLNYCKPDIVITKNDFITAIIEIKFRPWDYPEFKSDLNKLIKFDNWAIIERELVFGYIPFSDNWHIQKNRPNKKYVLNQDHLNVLIVVAKSDSPIFQTDNYTHPRNFLLLTGHIKKGDDEHFKILK